MLYAANLQTSVQALVALGGVRALGLSQVAASAAGGSVNGLYSAFDFRRRMRQTSASFSGFARNWISAHVDNEVPLPFHSGLVPDTVLMGTDA